MKKFCRLCLKECRSSSQDLFVDSSVLLNHILLCFSIKLNINEHYPKHICDICTIKIKETVSFREMIIDSDKFLKEKFLFILGNVAIETNVKLKSENDSNILELCDDVHLKSENGTINIEPDRILIQDSNNEVTCAPNESINNIIKLENKHNNTNLKECENNVTNKGIEYNSQTELPPNTCLMCFKSFPNETSLIKHYLTEENNDYLKLTAEIDLYEKTDVKIVNNSTLYICKECGVEKKKTDIMKHLLSHSKVWPYTCKICGRMYLTPKQIANHGKSHSSIRYACSYKCGFSSGYSHIVKNHEMRHNKIYKYKCKDCGKSFQVKTWYEQHQNIHKGIKEFVCSICGAAFHMDRYLTTHKNSVHADSVTRKPYNCVHCSVVCRSKQSLNLHLQDHGVKKEYLCDVCGKVMKNTGQLKVHKRVHRDDRPFVCVICNKSFAKKFNLKLHQAVHTNDRFECTVCDKTFTQRSSLNRHKLRKHSKED